MISDTEGGCTSGQETQNETGDNDDRISQAETMLSGASSDVEEGTNIDNNKR